ncbi:MAG TPA: oxygenase MpaB family protein [Pyrinomonadaceae bacterium]|nr:oxygenase MpaB family protein [Pyrinomonadaceae bacterium]
MGYFVDRRSVVRTIWGRSDLILLVFAGAAAEFALNRAVDWLFFTNKIPQDPIGRLFSTVRYAQEIVFAYEQTARQAMNRINAVHGGVERRRGQSIPEWAHRDVLYMLIDYSERAHQTLRRPLTRPERQELYDVFLRVGEGLHVRELPRTYADWKSDRQSHLVRDLAYSEYTAKLFGRYRAHLGAWRYELLRMVQAQLVPRHVGRLLGLRPSLLLSNSLWMYPVFEQLGLKPFIERALLPPQHLEDVRKFERPAGLPHTAN